MNFTEFTVNNVKRNIKSYLGYFFSMLISSSLLFSFNMFVNHQDLDIKISLSTNLTYTLHLCKVYLYLFFIYLKSKHLIHY